VGRRLLLAQTLVLLAGGVTTWVVASVVGPPLFREHLHRAGVAPDSDEQFHAEQAYQHATALSIAVAITVGVALHDAQIVFSLARMGGALMALAVIGVLLYLAFRYGEHLLRLIGEAGTAVFLRLTAFILLCLGVQIVWDGLRELLLEVMSVPMHLAAVGAFAGAG
jgi:hypothetical protein